ncbi:Na(+)-translocating NADH-quinone reductase subunit A [Hydrocarboniclastica marina]|uniref:Na(+)-translocating NADH-quinone reductase subunit A n=1 Tax=Hydrocarboniclastica marina TaxID=2259620 RepID=A0A4P7XI70_9ALTE|nr:Na(+)-translocating NADH-quinone reductase subunit A [Hydrocarboniclastica marina]QCF25567.1 Na(+)-translocating NADH-quinone reductase subunit A [Hydrocarboniclastica marina]
MIKIKKGLDLPISGAPEQTISAGRAVSEVALVGFDYVGMKPTMMVREGDRVKRGSLLFVDKKTEGVQYTSPAGGTVKAINRGDRRVFQSVVIEIDQNEEVETFPSYTVAQLDSVERQQVVDNLVKSGLWTLLRTRPYSKVPAINSVPHSIFVPVMDTNPLAADPEVIVAEEPEAFTVGLQVLTKLTTGKVFVCSGPDAKLPLPENKAVEQHSFSGPHPAGNVGTHIHNLDPASGTKTVWHVGYQDVIAIAKLFLTGEVPAERVVAITGPQAVKPRLVRTRVGASLDQLLEGEANSGPVLRMISGSVFGGRTAAGPIAYLGRYSNQITILEEGHKREFMGWITPGSDKFSRLNIYISRLFRRKPFDMNTTTNGSERAMVPVGLYEEVMPLDILPTPLLRSLIVGDTEMAQKLGALELDEEDLALCTFVCPGKYEYGPILRQNLTRIEVEG